LDHRVGHDSADALDVERAAGGEKFQPSGRLRRAGDVFAAPGDKLRIAPDPAAADRTFAVHVLEKIERLRVARPFRFHHLDDGRNDFAGLFDHNRVADADVFAFDFIFVVQRRARYRAAAYQYRFEHGNWR